ncbi:MAG: hypothetical protein AB1716_01295 [Planctomycetota bacterium]
MNRSLTPASLCLALLALGTLPACTAPQRRPAAAAAQVGRVAPADNRDHLIGFYRMPDYNWDTGAELPGEGTIIPVLKHGDTYFSVSRGFEVPFKPCPAGLKDAWGDTTIGHDPATGEYYIRIFDPLAENFIPDSMDPAPYRGLKRALYRIDPPRWLADATAAPPRALEDFAGDYELLWCPAVFHHKIRNQNGQFVLKVSGAGYAAEETQPLTPLSDQLGFEGPGRNSRLVYNAALRRFELVLQRKGTPAGAESPSGENSTAEPIRIPLVRLSPIGIPWTKG